MGAGHFTRMHRTLPCWGWPPALSSCKDDDVREKGKIPALRPGLHCRRSRGAAGERCCDGTEMWSQVSTRPSFLRHCRATLHLHTDFFPPSDLKRDLVNVRVVFHHCAAVTTLVCLPRAAKAVLPAPTEINSVPGEI